MRWRQLYVWNLETSFDTALTVVVELTRKVGRLGTRERENRARFTVSGVPTRVPRNYDKHRPFDVTDPGPRISPSHLRYQTSLHFPIERIFPSAFRSVPDYSSRFLSWSESLSARWTSCPRNTPSDRGFGK